MFHSVFAISMFLSLRAQKVKLSTRASFPPNVLPAHPPSSCFFHKEDAKFINSFGSFSMLRAVGLHEKRCAPDSSVHIFKPLSKGAAGCAGLAQKALDLLKVHVTLPEPKAWGFLGCGLRELAASDSWGGDLRTQINQSSDCLL